MQLVLCSQMQRAWKQLTRDCQRHTSCKLVDLYRNTLVHVNPVSCKMQIGPA